MTTVKNTAPIINPITKQRLTRRFLGNISPTNCFEKKELKAYLKGQTHFDYKNDMGQENEGMRFKVRQVYFYV